MTLRQDQLRAASFRGVPFFVEEAGLEAGRRTQVHEYPQRDKPYSEDMGRAARSMSITAFVVGDDYIAQSERLLAALEQGGAGTLVHPWLGTMQVTVGVCRVSYSSGALGYVRFEIPCTEAGELVFPSTKASTQAGSRLAADALTEAAAADFAESFTVDGVPDFVVDGAVADVGTVVRLLSVQVPGLESLGYADKLAAQAQSIISSVGQPNKLASALTSALGLAALAATGTRWASVVQSLTRLAGGTGLANPLPPAVITANRVQAWTNTSAINALARRALLAQAVGASSVMEPTVLDDVLAVRNALTAALDAEALTAGDAVFKTLQSARTTAWQDLTTRSRGSARLRTYTPPAPLPALVVAYSLYGDASRDAEIIARNRVRHPGFVPVAPLQVLTQ